VTVFFCCEVLFLLYTSSRLATVRYGVGGGELRQINSDYLRFFLKN